MLGRLVIPLASILVLATGCSATAGASRSAPAAGEAAAPAAVSSTPARYYVALGDSLAAGTAPGRLFGEGYPEHLLRLRRSSRPGLRLVKLACPGETTAAMRSGGRCPYPRGSQLAQAKAFLRANRGKVTLVTVGIGANDLLACRGDEGACARRATASTRKHLPPILRELRAAAGPTVRIVGMDYYAPLLARWLDGADGEHAARRHVSTAVVPGNEALRGVYRAQRVPVARVEAAFATRSFTPAETMPDGRAVPRNVARICRLTWMCSRGDIHANGDGHRAIARAFDAQLRR